MTPTKKVSTQNLHSVRKKRAVATSFLFVEISFEPPSPESSKHSSIVGKEDFHNRIFSS